MEAMKLQKKVTASTMLDPKILLPAILSSFVKLDPRLMIKSPVMFVVEIVAALKSDSTWMMARTSVGSRLYFEA